MKKTILSSLTGLSLLLALAACGGDASSPSMSQPAATPSSAAASRPVAASASLPASQPTSQAASVSQAASAPGATAIDLAPLLEPIKVAAGITDAIEVTNLDLRAGGIDTAGIIGFVGAESATASQDAGIVIVAQASPDAIDALKAQLEAFRDSRLDDRYAEFADAMARTKEARILTGGANRDLLVYAVTANGDWAALDAAIAAALA